MSRVLSQISIENYLGGVKQKLGRNQQLVLQALEDYDRPASAEIIAAQMGWPINSISGRFTELARKKEIRVAYEQRNQRGYKVRYWIPSKALLEYGDSL